MIKNLIAAAALVPVMASAQFFNPMPMPQMVQPAVQQNYGFHLNTEVQQRQQAELQAYQALQQQHEQRRAFQMQQQQIQQLQQQLNQRRTGLGF